MNADGMYSMLRGLPIKEQCATCINEQMTIKAVENLLDDLGIPGEFNMVFGAIQNAARRYHCPDYFRSFQPRKGGL